MGQIEKKLSVKGDKDKKDVNILFDSGATHSVIRKDIAEELFSINRFTEPEEVGTAKKGGRMQSIGTVAFHTRLDNCEITDQALVVDELRSEMIIGASTLQKYEIKMLFDGDNPRLDLTECRRRIEYI